MDQGEFASLAAAEGFSDAVIGEFNVGALIDAKGGMNSMMWTINLIILSLIHIWPARLCLTTSNT